MRRPTDTSPSALLARAERGDPGALGAALRRLDAFGAGERQRLLSAALTAAERRADYTLLIAALRRTETPPEASLRADALAVVLGVADALHPRFAELIAALRGGERELLVGALLEASRLDPDPERRLQRLGRLVRAIPRARRDRYWPEARALADRGGDDAQLALLGFARQLPEPLRPATLATLRRSVRRVRAPFKRTMAFVALAELAPPPTETLTDALAEALAAAARIPDPALRTMASARLAELRGDADA